MGSKGGTAAPPPSKPPSPQPSVCCMCGDQGFPRELFRCKVCIFRSQHKYCSNLYPTAESYRACNWCLREETGSKFLLITEPVNAGRSSSGCSAGSGLKLTRGVFSPHLNKPVKKQRLGERQLQPPADSGDRGGGEELSPGSGRGRQVFRGKVRRYKLLEDVSS